MIEVKIARQLTQYRSRNNWRGRRTFVTEEANIESDCLSLWGQRWDGTAGPTCTMTQATWWPSGISGVGLIEAYYDTEQYLVSTPGYATLSGSIASRQYKPAEDLNGYPLDGYDDEGNFYAVVDGDPSVEDYQTKLEIQTAYDADTFDLLGILSLERKVNDAAVTIFGRHTFPAGTLKCLGVAFGERIGGNLVYLRSILQYSQTPWNQMVSIQRGKYVIKDIYKTNDAGVIVEDEEPREVVQWEPTPDVPIVKAKLNNTIDMSRLQALSRWAA